MPEADSEGRENKQEPPAFIQESSINNFISLFLGDDLMPINDRAGALGNLSTYPHPLASQAKEPSPGKLMQLPGSPVAPQYRPWMVPGMVLASL